MDDPKRPRPRRPPDEMPLTAVPDPVDKAAHLQWLFGMARRDHIAALKREKARLKWEAERERQRQDALKSEP